jgi:glycosyltransferase involved in cell wall biosynthesis
MTEKGSMKGAPMNRELDVICFSHLRWNFVFQRPNHLMSLCSKERRVFFFEEPLLDGGAAKLNIRSLSPSLHVVTPGLKPGQNAITAQRHALVELCEQHGIDMPITWFYTPMALEFARDFLSSLTVYDCMDELSAFRGAPPHLQELERELFARADLVFTGGRSLYEAKRNQNPNVHLFPSSVDVGHFAQARSSTPEQTDVARSAHADPADQAQIAGPRLGFFGVIDERIDLNLIANVARARPDWQIVMLGPVVKIDPGILPRLPNIHYLGQKAYADLPNYLQGWHVAVMPFALNESTRFISPTKTLEYLAGGVPVVSTPIADVVTPYAERGFVRVAHDCASFVQAVEQTLREGGLGEKLREVDAFIAGNSWANTWANMSRLVTESLATVESKVA